MKKVLLLILSLFVSPAFASGINANSASAPCTNNTLETYSGNTNLQADWQPNTINIRWYNENERLTVQSSAQSCVYDGTLTIPSTQPTRTGYTFAGWEVKHTIPAGYTELEYIESTGTQYIDTEIVPNADIKATGSFAVINTSAARNYVFGVTNAGNGRFQFSYSTEAFFGFGQAYARPVLSPNTNKHTFEADKNAFKIDENIVYIPINTTFDGNKTMIIFGCNETGGVVHSSQWKMYSFNIWSGGTLVRKFIPSRRNSDNVVGLYDTVSKTFLTNAGTGSFIAGPAVQ